MHGFGILSLFSIAGFFACRRSDFIDPVPPPLKAFGIVCLGYALLSGNLGRMFFGAYPVIIYYSIIGIDLLLSLEYSKQANNEK